MATRREGFRFDQYGEQSGGQDARTLLILGASGDLASRLLLPGLGGLIAAGGVKDIRLVGSGRVDMDQESWRRRVAESFRAGGAAGPAVETAIGESRYVRADTADADALHTLLGNCKPPVVVYFALPPAITERVCWTLRDIGVPHGTRFAIEKPFGHDAASAAALNELVTAIVPEDYVHRVDHFLGFSTILNILGLRLANRIFEPVLNAEHVAKVQITFDESLGLEGRAGYYEGAGALVDMVQSHLLQVLALVAMEAPSSLEARISRGAIAGAPRHPRLEGRPGSVQPSRPLLGRFGRGTSASGLRGGDGRRPGPQDGDVRRDRRRGGHLALGGGPVPPALGQSHRRPEGRGARRVQGPGATPGWVHRLPGPRPPPLRHRARRGEALPRGQHQRPGDPVELDRATLEAEVGAGALHEYGETLKRILAGDPTFSVRGDMAVECWRIVEPVLETWRRDEVPLTEYAAGGAGPGEGWTDGTL